MQSSLLFCLAVGVAGIASEASASTTEPSQGGGLQLSGGAKANEDGVSTQSRKSQAGGSKKGSSKSSDGGGRWPELVYGGNSIAFTSPLQMGVLGYEPRLRFGLQYDRQWHKPNWLYIGAAALFDRGDFSTFRADTCGLENQEGTCGKGAVAGFDSWAGYAYKFYLKDTPWFVPMVRAGVGVGWWKYPNLGGSRQQDRVSTFSISGHIGGGMRLFITPYLGFGMDVNVQVGFNRHLEKPLSAPQHRTSDFLIGLQALPLLVEYRF